MIFSTDFIPARFDAMAVWPFILVRPAQRENRGLIEHELVHYREQRWLTLVWWARYLLSSTFRQAAEVRAYRRQMEVGGISAGAAAHYLSEGYTLGISYDAALVALTT